MKILFVLGFSNPFPGAAWTRIGYFAEAWSKRGHSIDVLGAVGYNSFTRSGFRKSGEVKIFNLILNVSINEPLIFILDSLISFMTSSLFLLARKPDIVIVSVPKGLIYIAKFYNCH